MLTCSNSPHCFPNIPSYGGIWNSAGRMMSSINPADSAIPANPWPMWFIWIILWTKTWNWRAIFLWKASGENMNMNRMKAVTRKIILKQDCLRRSYSNKTPFPIRFRETCQPGLWFLSPILKLCKPSLNNFLSFIELDWFLFQKSQTCDADSEKN